MDRLFILLKNSSCKVFGVLPRKRSGDWAFISSSWKTRSIRATHAAEKILQKQPLHWVSGWSTKRVQGQTIQPCLNSRIKTMILIHWRSQPIHSKWNADDSRVPSIEQQQQQTKTINSCSHKKNSRIHSPGELPIEFKKKTTRPLLSFSKRMRALTRSRGKTLPTSPRWTTHS